MAGRGWVMDPHSGGNKVPEAVKRDTVARLERHAAAHFAGRYHRLDIRFRGALCYVDATTEPDEPGLPAVPLHLCRLRYFAPDRWSLAFYTYSNERYEPCAFRNDTFYGTPEEGLDIGAIYLT